MFIVITAVEFASSSSSEEFAARKFVSDGAKINKDARRDSDVNKLLTSI